jgi:hypothetical protein
LSDADLDDFAVKMVPARWNAVMMTDRNMFPQKCCEPTTLAGEFAVLDT